MRAASPSAARSRRSRRATTSRCALRCRPIALAACLQLDAVSYNAFIQEQSLGIHYNQGNDLLDYLRNPEVFRYEDGFVAIPQARGRHRRERGEGARDGEDGAPLAQPVWRHEDGSVAEW